MDNQTAVGYVIKTLQELGYNETKISEVEAHLFYIFDQYTEDEAKTFFRGF